jgi:hypothetical protein
MIATLIHRTMNGTVFLTVGHWLSPPLFGFNHSMPCFFGYTQKTVVQPRCTTVFVLNIMRRFLPLRNLLRFPRRVSCRAATRAR